ncbi:hypothetical protein [Streptomyces sp. NPDC088135]|uniref:hypothetical protein n=2 Tax=unclassified Streptomyces TaxID=2593676 RepID=UPI0034194D34
MTDTDHTVRGDQSTAVLLQHVEELRGALAHAVRLLSHSAGREAADNPGHAERLMTTAVHLTDLLARTAPATAPDILAVTEASDYVRHGGLTRSECPERHPSLLPTADPDPDPYLSSGYRGERGVRVRDRLARTV